MLVAIEPELEEAVLDEVAAGRIEPGGADRGAVTNGDASRRVETPYLQLVLQRVWEVERDRGSSSLRLATFHELGGAQRIVEDHLERALAALTPSQQDAAATVFGHLVTPSGTKIAHGLSDLAIYASLPETELEPMLQSPGARTNPPSPRQERQRRRRAVRDLPRRPRRRCAGLAAASRHGRRVCPRARRGTPPAQTSRRAPNHGRCGAGAGFVACRLRDHAARPRARRGTFGKGRLARFRRDGQSRAGSRTRHASRGRGCRHRKERSTRGRLEAVVGELSPTGSVERGGRGALRPRPQACRSRRDARCRQGETGARTRRRTPAGERSSRISRSRCRHRGRRHDRLGRRRHSRDLESTPDRSAARADRSCGNGAGCSFLTGRRDARYCKRRWNSANLVGRERRADRNALWTRELGNTIGVQS